MWRGAGGGRWRMSFFFLGISPGVWCWIGDILRGGWVDGGGEVCFKVWIPNSSNFCQGEVDELYGLLFWKSESALLRVWIYWTRSQLEMGVFEGAVVIDAKQKTVTRNEQLMSQTQKFVMSYIVYLHGVYKASKYEQTTNEQTKPSRLPKSKFESE
ncbi:uncharacterized protein BO66DRAFT_449733, partial [Aspergillus aculeatinus CBS 121060]